MAATRSRRKKGAKIIPLPVISGGIDNRAKQLIQGRLREIADSTALELEDVLGDGVQLDLIQLAMVQILIDPNAKNGEIIRAGKALAEIKGLDKRSRIDEELLYMRKIREALAVKPRANEKDITPESDRFEAHFEADLDE